MLTLVFSPLLVWMPLPLVALCAGAMAIFFIVTILRIVALVLDFIPFF